MVELFLLMDHPNVVHTTKNGIDHKVTVIYEISKKGFGQDPPQNSATKILNRIPTSPFSSK